MNQNKDGYIVECNAWNLKEFSYDCEDTEDSSKITKIFCLVCKHIGYPNGWLSPEWVN